jgi:hypothetical protein
MEIEQEEVGPPARERLDAGPPARHYPDELDVFLAAEPFREQVLEQRIVFGYQQ